MLELHAFRPTWALPAALLAAASFVASPTPAMAQQASSRATVLVAPLRADAGVKSSLGRDVADEVRDRLKSITTLAPIDQDAVKSALDRIHKDAEDLSPVQWRQLANQLHADLLVSGTITRASGGNLFHVSFIDVRSGDETQVPEFTVADEGGKGVKEAADHVMTALRSQVDFQRAVLICSDYVSSEQWEDAARNCEQALAINPNSNTTKYLMARIEMGRENWSAAEGLLNDVIAANPADVDALKSLAYTEAQLGNTSRARELYNEYLGFNPDDADVRMSVAYDLAQAGDYDGAVGLLRDGLARDSTNAAMWKFLGDIRLNQVAAGPADSTVLTVTDETAGEQATREAIEAYRHVLDLRGAETDPQILKNVVAAYLQLGDIDEAGRFAERAEGQLPQDAALRSLKADIRARREDYRGAVAAMDEALKLDPDLPRGLTKRGMYKLSAGDEQGAMADFRAAVDRGDDPDAIAQQMLSRGYEAYFKNDQFDRAAQTFSTALEFARQQATKQQLEFFLAFSYYQSGANIDTANEAEACAPARRALERFQKVVPHLNGAGSFQARNQGEIRAATDTQIYRQQAILKKPACRS